MDWITGNIYFVDDVSDQIFISNAEGNKVVPILNDGLDQPQGIALDPTKGYALPFYSTQFKLLFCCQTASLFFPLDFD